MTKINIEYPNTLKMLQALRVTTDVVDSEIHHLIDNAYIECKKKNSLVLLQRVLLHVGDVSRQHNLLKEMGIESPNGGAQQRKVFRSILRWWESNLPESFYKNLRVFTEFTLYENLVFYQITSDRYTGDIIDVEKLIPNTEYVFPFLKERIDNGKDIKLIAKHLPKYTTGNNRTTTKINQHQKMWTVPVDKGWVKINGKLIEPGTEIKLDKGDIIKYSRKKSEEALKRQKTLNKWIIDFCKYMNWDISKYKKFRSIQDTPEQKFSTGSIHNLSKQDFFSFLDNLTSGQRFRVIGILQNARYTSFDEESKWKKQFEWYNEWETNQETIAQKLRESFDKGDEVERKKLQKELKVKSTGKTTFDLLVDLFSDKYTDQQIDNTYQSMIEKMDLVANVFPVIDGSGSMGMKISGTNISYMNIAFALAIAFSTRNPNTEFRNSLGWFSRNFNIIGNSKFKNLKPNPWVEGNEFYKKSNKTEKVLSPKNTFTTNYKNLKESNPGDVSSTDMGSVIKYFMDFAEKENLSPESLPQALLFITDNEHNTGESPIKVLNRANEIGWNPLCIFWGIQAIPDYMFKEFSLTPNVLMIGGFSESVLSQILRGIKTGSVNPEEELWVINNDKRYSVIKAD